MPGTSELPEGAVIITTADIYRQLLELTREVGELKGGLQETTKMFKALEDHETRLRALERARWPLPALAMLISIGALVAQVVSGH